MMSELEDIKTSHGKLFDSNAQDELNDRLEHAA